MIRQLLETVAAVALRVAVKPGATHTVGAAGNQLSGQNRTYYRRSFIAELVPRLLLARFGIPGTIPQNEGPTISWPNMNPLEEGETLTEGADGSEGTLTLGAITATLATVGKYHTFSEDVDIIAPDPVLEELFRRKARRAARDIEKITREVLTASTNITRPSTHVADATITATDVIDADTCERMVAAFVEADVDPVLDMLSPNGGSGTVPGPAAYIGHCHADVVYDLKKATGFVRVSDYAEGNDVLPGEVGMLDDIRWLNAGTDGDLTADAGVGNVDVYHCPVFGADAYGTVDLAGRPAQMYVVPPSQVSHGNPLAQRGKIGYKLRHAAAILQTAAVGVINVAATRGSN